ncbi:substrate-binding domain-containing protein [Actinomyces culturomici]|uniref:substrate-binding domain-containing protein n=1 Tax=Actinomyces culturomici TaxID=1926276 RepID=UPI001356B52E|nr:substrate-binding domain-containing protein [Actinomyces culturomici]
MDHLVDLGHRRIAHIRGPEDSPSAAVRHATWMRRMEERGLRSTAPLIGGWSVSDGYRAGLELADEAETTAVFCANDEVALGCIAALRSRGIDVPGDMSVVGFDGLPLAEHFLPPLTTVVQDFHAAGTTMVELVAEQIEHGIADGTRRVLIPTELVVRATTAPPRG